MKSLLRFLQTPAVALLSAALVFEAAAFYVLSRGEEQPLIALMRTLPQELPPWRALDDGELDEYTRTVLHPDDYLMRTYQREAADGAAATLFIAYFRTQRTGHVPHSPRNCLPGSGWVANRGGTIEVPGGGEPAIRVNRFVVAKGQAQAVVLYWYQTASRAVANEFAAKIFLALDSVRYRRSDTALVRIAVPVAGGEMERQSERMAAELAGLVSSALRHHLDGRNLLRTGTLTPLDGRSHFTSGQRIFDTCSNLGVTCVDGVHCSYWRPQFPAHPPAS